MIRSSYTLALLMVLGSAVVAAPARADESTGTYETGDWPLAATERPLTLGARMLEIRGDTLGVNLSKSNVGKPVFVAPDFFFGFSDRLSIGLTHLVGVCLSGPEGNCAEGYNDLGLEADYSLMRGGNLQLMGHAALVFPSFSPFMGGLDLGLMTRIRGGKIAIVADPTLYLGALGRDEVYVSFGPTLGPKEVFRLPVDLQYQLNVQTMVFLSTGVAGPLDGFGDSYAIPVGLGALFAINNRVDLGLELEFPNALGKGENKADYRLLYARFALRI